MFRITWDPSSGSLVQYLAKNYKNGSIVSVEMDKVCVKAPYAAITPCHSSFSFQLPVCTFTSPPVRPRVPSHFNLSLPEIFPGG